MQGVPHVPVSAVTGNQALQLGDSAGGLEATLMERQKKTVDIYRFADSLPSVFESKHGRVCEGCADLQHSIEVMQAPADIRHSSPFF